MKAEIRGCGNIGQKADKNRETDPGDSAETEEEDKKTQAVEARGVRSMFQ